MTPEELHIVKTNAQILATQALLIGITKMLARSSRDEKQFLREMATTMRENFSLMTVPGLKPGYSDLLAGELQSAVDDLIQLFEPD